MKAFAAVLLAFAFASLASAQGVRESEVSAGAPSVGISADYVVGEPSYKVPASGTIICELESAISLSQCEMAFRLAYRTILLGEIDFAKRMLSERTLRDLKLALSARDLAFEEWVVKNAISCAPPRLLAVKNVFVSASPRETCADLRVEIEGHEQDFLFTFEFGCESEACEEVTIMPAGQFMELIDVIKATQANCEESGR